MERLKSLDLKVGDRVNSKAYGLGTVVRILSSAINTFPVEVEFDSPIPGRRSKDMKYMTTGQWAVGGPDSEKDIVKVGE